jgi:hypothetical protein
MRESFTSLIKGTKKWDYLETSGDQKKRKAKESSRKGNSRTRPKKKDLESVLDLESAAEWIHGKTSIPLEVIQQVLEAETCYMKVQGIIR